MCRFVYYQGESLPLSHLLTEPRHSLIHQSFHSHEREEPLNGDGFGLAWYLPGEERPARFRSITPAWNNQNLVEVARVTSSGRILAHIRASTQGFGVVEPNCHPFRHGALTFMHNGDIEGFEGIRRPLLAGLSDDAWHMIRGSTDSEHFFALIVDELGAEEPAAPTRLVDAVRRALDRLRELMEREGCRGMIYLNTVLTDGVSTVATRFTSDTPDRADSLYLLDGYRYTVDGGSAHTVECDPERSSVLISSEPLTPDHPWREIPVGSILTVTAEGSVETTALA